MRASISAVPLRHDPRRAAAAYRTPSGTFLEEGVTEAATQDLLPTVLQRCDGMAPGIGREAPDRRGVYPNYVPAVREVPAVVQGLPEMRGRDALRELARQGPERKFDLLVEQAMDGFGLTLNVPARDRAGVRVGIRGALEAHVRRNAGWMVPPDSRRPAQLDTREPAGLSKIMGMRMGQELHRQLHLEGERVGMDLPQDWRTGLAKKELDLADRALRAAKPNEPETRQAAKRWADDATRRMPPARAHRVQPRSLGDGWLAVAGRHSQRRVRAVGPFAGEDRGIIR